MTCSITLPSLAWMMTCSTIPYNLWGVRDSAQVSLILLGSMGGGDVIFVRRYGIENILVEVITPYVFVDVIGCVCYF